ncbi:cytochrome P450 [Streptomyces sp. NPDC049954]|uniref:cytochrome P450 n=1 Tax=Streptomyces sp. NPDC049954 TaxID=3155779 RepID=UPI0034341C41
MEQAKQAIADSAQDWIEHISPEDLLHPQAITTRLRQEAPLAWVPAAGMYLATSWDLCHQIANDSENFESVAIPLAKRVFGTPDVLSTEGDLHASLRRAVGTPVSARAIRSQIESRMRPTAQGLIERIRGQSRAELMAEYFEPISVRCVADSYGFFEVETDTLRRWFHDLKSGAVNAATHADGSFANPAGFDGADRARAEIRGYLEEKSKDDPEAPDSVIARWLNSDSPDGVKWSIDFILPSMLVVLLGGLQEPGHALGNTFLGLATNPDQLRRVVAEPALLPKAIAEGLRWMAPLYAGPTRSARHDLVLNGVPLGKGDVVRLVYGSANHDSDTFDHPELYDMDRPSHAHLAFGDGRHSCVGSALAPQIARVALEELFAAFPDIALDPSRTAAAMGWPFHGPPELHVVLS